MYLSNIGIISGIKHLIYCHFLNINGVIFILSLFKEYKINILDLTGNGIETINERFVAHPSTKHIKSLDLKHNKVFLIIIYIFFK